MAKAFFSVKKQMRHLLQVLTKWCFWIYRSSQRTKRICKALFIVLSRQYAPQIRLSIIRSWKYIRYADKRRKMNAFFKSHEKQIKQWHKAHGIWAPLPVYWDKDAKDFRWRSRDGRRTDSKRKR